MKRLLVLVPALGLILCGCRSAPPQARMPTEGEVGPESVVVNYAPEKLRLFPTTNDGAAAGTPRSYLILGSERPELPAKYRPLGGTAQKAPPEFIARAGSFAYVAGHVVEAIPAQAQGGPRFTVYDRDGKLGTDVEVKLPTSCAPRLPALLQTDGARLYALVECAPNQVVLLTLDDKAQLIASQPVVGASRAERFIHQPDADYVLSGRQVLRLKAGSDELPAIGAVPTPGELGREPVRELLRAGELILVVDGGAGRVTALDAGTMSWRFEKRFAVGSPKSVREVRATIGAPGRLYIVTAEESAQGSTLFGTMLQLSSGDSEPPPRIFLGPALDNAKAQAARTLGSLELLPIAEAEGGGAILVFIHSGNSGPLVALRKLSL